MALLKLALSALLLAGCASTLDYHECNTNDDCASRASDGGKLYCTNDHFCVLGVPDEQLCDDSQTLGTDAPGSLVIGVLTDHSNLDDQAIAKAVQLAVSEINPLQGGGSQPPLVVHFCDTAKDPTQALRAATRAVEFFHAAALIGPTTSDDVLKIAQYAKDTKTLVVSPSATAGNITSLVDDNEVWRTCPSDSLQGVLLAKMVKAAAMGMGAPVIGSLNVESIYGTGLTQTFINEFQSLDPNLVVATSPFATSSDIPLAMSMLGKPSPTQALLVADIDAPAIVGRLGMTVGLEKTQFFMTDAAKGPGLFGPSGSTDPSVLKRIQGTSPSDPAGSVFDTFRTSYKNKFAMMDPASISFVANAYDATYVVAIAAAATTGRVPSGQDLATGMGKFMKKIGTAVAVGPMGYSMAVKQMAMGGVRVLGASGPMEFDGNGDLTTASYDCWSIDTSTMTFAIKSSPCPTFP